MKRSNLERFFYLRRRRMQRTSSQAGSRKQRVRHRVAQKRKRSPQRKLFAARRQPSDQWVDPETRQKV